MSKMERYKHKCFHVFTPFSAHFPPKWIVGVIQYYSHACTYRGVLTWRQSGIAVLTFEALKVVLVTEGNDSLSCVCVCMCVCVCVYNIMYVCVCMCV